jgi:hypothetical protein
MIFYEVTFRYFVPKKRERDIPPRLIGSENFDYPWLFAVDGPLDRESLCVVIHDREGKRGG